MIKASYVKNIFKEWNIYRGNGGKKKYAKRRRPNDEKQLT